MTRDKWTPYTALNMIQFNSDAEIHDVKSDDLTISMMMLMSSHLR